MERYLENLEFQTKRYSTILKVNKIFLDSQENFFDDNPFLAIFDLRKDNDIQNDKILSFKSNYL